MESKEMIKKYFSHNKVKIQLYSLTVNKQKKSINLKDKNYSHLFFLFISNLQLFFIGLICPYFWVFCCGRETAKITKRQNVQQQKLLKPRTYFVISHGIKKLYVVLYKKKSCVKKLELSVLSGFLVKYFDIWTGKWEQFSTKFAWLCD